MSTEIDNQEDQVNAADELSVLKARAKMMGLTVSNNIGVETLREKIAAFQAGETKRDEDVNPNKVNPLETESVTDPKDKPKTLRQHLIDENMKLVRIRIANMDPKKKDIPGEVITVANEYLGTVRKYVPFGEQTEGGYHVPYVLYKLLKSRKYLNIRTYVDKKNNNQIRVEHNWVPEFAIEVLPPLTPKELQNLATAQIAAGSIT